MERRVTRAAAKLAAEAKAPATRAHMSPTPDPGPPRTTTSSGVKLLRASRYTLSAEWPAPVSTRRSAPAFANVSTTGRPWVS